MKKYALEIIVFTSGAVVMILELVGSRVLAPYVGTSIHVWTALIGIILACLSIGYYVGGRLADTNPNFKTLSLILFSAGILIGILAFVKEDVLSFLASLELGIRSGAVVSTIVLFAPPSVLLGMVSPYAVRLKISDVQTSGATVGVLIALSTLGSIVGTFLAGFVLIALIGTTKILYLLAFILVLISLYAYSNHGMVLKLAVALILIGFAYNAHVSEIKAAEQGFVDIDTEYNRVWITERDDWRTGKPIRLFLVGGENDSAMFLDSDELVFEYTQFYRLDRHFKPDLKRGLMIGGAGYSYPKDFLRSFPDAIIDVVEIDPGLTQLAREYFNLEDNSRLNIFHEDGRTFLNSEPQKYDVIYGDAFSSFYSIPHHLTTREAVEHMYNMLEDDGVALINIISGLTGNKAKFLKAQYKTFQEFFPQLYLFPTRTDENTLDVQNLILVALKSEEPPQLSSADPEIQEYLDHLWQSDITTDLPVLTDEFAPVDQYVAEFLQ